MDNMHSSSESNGLEQRLRHLEEQARFTLDVLEMASTLGDFQTCINKLHEPTALLEETIHRIGELVHFTASAFYLVDEASSDFGLTLCEPALFRTQLDDEVQHLIDNGVFALAVRENRPITVYSRDNKYRMVLHVLATSSRTRGMFVGVMSKGERNLSGILLSLLSIVLKHCANAIESFELYRLFRQRDRDQREYVDSLPGLVVESDMHGIVCYANTMAHQAGVTEGMAFHECVAECDRERVASMIGTLQCAGDCFTGTLTLDGMVGDVCETTMRAVVVSGGSGLHVRYVLLPAAGE